MKKRILLLSLCMLLIAAVIPAAAFAADPLKIEVTGVPVNLNVGMDVPTPQTMKVLVNGVSHPFEYVVMSSLTKGRFDGTYLEGGKITQSKDYVINMHLSGLPKGVKIGSVTVNGSPVTLLDTGGQVKQDSNGRYYIFHKDYVDAGAIQMQALERYGKIYDGVLTPYDGEMNIQCLIHVGTENFPFTDVATNNWAYNFIKTAYESGIVGGTTATTYSPNGQLTHGQIMVMVANLHSKQKGDGFKGSSAAGDHWAASFRDYCKAEGIIDDRFDEVLDKPVTRAEMAYYFANTLTAESYKNEKEFSLSDIADNTYKAEIERLAAANIVGGYSDGTFKPANLVNRAEAAVFISNILGAMGE